jgi:hypothetical protein
LLLVTPLHRPAGEVAGAGAGLGDGAGGEGAGDGEGDGEGLGDVETGNGEVPASSLPPPHAEIDRTLAMRAVNRRIDGELKFMVFFFSVSVGLVRSRIASRY